MTHDLLKNLITQIEGDVLRVVINSLKENTFYAQIHLRVANKDVLVDSRPSDAIALALRLRAPVFVEESVLEMSRSGEDTAEAQNAERLEKVARGSRSGHPRQVPDVIFRAGRTIRP